MTAKTARKGNSPVRTTRIGDDIWEAAKVRASKDGVSMSQMMLRLVEGYSKGKIALPRVEMVYDQPTTSGTPKARNARR